MLALCEKKVLQEVLTKLKCLVKNALEYMDHEIMIDITHFKL